MSAQERAFVQSMMKQYCLTEQQVHERARTSYGSLKAAMRVMKGIEEEQAEHIPQGPVLQVGVRSALCFKKRITFQHLPMLA